MENNNTQQPDYLNPQSDKFYKGYRYEMDEFGNERWFDANGIKRKEISSLFKEYWNENVEKIINLKNIKNLQKLIKIY